MSLQDDINNLTQDPSVVPWPVKIGMMVVMAGGILFAGYKLFIVDDIAQLEMHQAKEPTLLQELKKKQKRASLLPIYKAQLEEMQASFSSMTNQLPSRTEIPDLILEISETAISNGLLIEVFEPKAEILQEFYAEKPIKLRVVGNYNQLGAFASAIADMPRIVTLHNVNLSPKELEDDQVVTKEDRVDLIMTADIKTYRYLEEEL